MNACIYELEAVLLSCLMSARLRLKSVDSARLKSEADTAHVIHQRKDSALHILLHVDEEVSLSPHDGPVEQWERDGSKDE